MTDKTLSDATLQMYEWGLEDVSIDAIESAARACIKGGLKYGMPKPSELRELAGAGELSFADRAQQAWIELDRCVRRVAPSRSVKFADACTSAAVASVGGLEHLVAIDGEEYTSFARAAFIRAYESLARTGPPAQHADYVWVHPHDAENTLRGYVDDVKPPLLIGTSLPALPVRVPIEQLPAMKPGALPSNVNDKLRLAIESAAKSP